MTLPASGIITLDDIKNEFGGSGDIVLSDYYGAHPALPSSGIIQLSDFYGLADGHQITSGSFQESISYAPSTIYYEGYASGQSPFPPDIGSIDDNMVFGTNLLYTVNAYRVDIWTNTYIEVKINPRYLGQTFFSTIELVSPNAYGGVYSTSGPELVTYGGLGSYSRWVFDSGHVYPNVGFIDGQITTIVFT